MSESAMAPTRGRRALSAILLSAGLLLAVSASAEAQGFARSFFDDDILPPRVVAWRLADRGFTGLSRPRFNGRVYVVDAVAPAGMPVRLILDPATGAIIDRQRLPGPEVYARLERPPMRTMPGYGWTEEEIVPPRPIPQEAEPGARPSRRPPREAARPQDVNPLGLNPDGARRADQPRTDSPRKVARTNPATGPERPALKFTPALKPAPDAAKPEAAKPEAAKPEATKPEPAKPEAAPKEMPAAPEAKPVAQAAPKQEWKDPPAEGKRPVRIIGGATVVPGTPGKAGDDAQ